MIDADEIKKLLSEAMPEAQVEVEDLTGTQDHYQARVISSSFEGLSRVQQHQLVYRALGAAMQGPIHALALKTYTPEAWEQSGKA